jgi:hypothetical protein
VAVNVLVVVMSAPGLEVLAVDRGDDVGLREVQQIGVALDVLGVIGEPVPSGTPLR